MPILSRRVRFLSGSIVFIVAGTGYNKVTNHQVSVSGGAGRWQILPLVSGISAIIADPAVHCPRCPLSSVRHRWLSVGAVQCPMSILCPAPRPAPFIYRYDVLCDNYLVPLSGNVLYTYGNVLCRAMCAFCPDSGAVCPLFETVCPLSSGRHRNKYKTMSGVHGRPCPASGQWAVTLAVAEGGQGPWPHL